MRHEGEVAQVYHQLGVRIFDEAIRQAATVAIIWEKGLVALLLDSQGWWEVEDSMFGRMTVSSMSLRPCGEWKAVMLLA